MLPEVWSMHEIGVVRQVLKTVENFAEENGLEKIDTIVLEIGDLSQGLSCQGSHCSLSRGHFVQHL